METIRSNSENGIRPASSSTPTGLLSKKQLHFAAHIRRKNAIANAMERRGYAKQAHAMHECTETEHLTGCSSCGNAWWVTTRCRQRICPICSFKVSQLRAKIIEGFIADLKHPKFVTLTMPRWTGAPRDGIAKLREAFLSLRKKGGIAELKGGCYSIEIIPKPDGWHIHMHLILDCAFIPHKKLIAAWGIALGVIAPSVDVRDATGAGAAKYVSKYVTKGLPKEADADAYVDLWEAIHGSRLFALFGDWYKDSAKLSKLSGENLEHKAKCPYCNCESCLFDVRTGYTIYGKDWPKMKELFQPKDGKVSREKDTVFRVEIDVVTEEASLDDENAILAP